MVSELEGGKQCALGMEGVESGEVEGVEDDTSKNDYIQSHTPLHM
jgi:hypothetical protein